MKKTIESAKTSRRLFLHSSCAVGMAVGCGAPIQGGSDPQSFGSVSAGNVSALPAGSLEAVSGEPLIIGRDAQGLYAMTSTCTHAGCDMTLYGDVTPQGVYCGCHGSRFDANGNVMRGPASAPLSHFAVAVDASGNITVDGTEQVAASVRTKVG